MWMPAYKEIKFWAPKGELLYPSKVKPRHSGNQFLLIIHQPWGFLVVVFLGFFFVLLDLTFLVKSVLIFILYISLLGAFWCLPLPPAGEKSKAHWRLRSVKLSPQMPLAPPIHILFSALPHLWVSCGEDWRSVPEACQKGAFLLLAGVSKGCLRDKSFPHPGVVAFPRLAAL